MSLQSELKALFPASIVKLARRLVPANVDAAEVHRAAGDLLALKGKPEEQVELVNGLDANTAAALCRWLSDPGFWSVVASVTKH